MPYGVPSSARGSATNTALRFASQVSVWTRSAISATAASGTAVRARPAVGWAQSMAVSQSDGSSLASLSGKLARSALTHST